MLPALHQQQQLQFSSPFSFIYANNQVAKKKNYQRKTLYFVIFPKKRSLKKNSKKFPRRWKNINKNRFKNKLGRHEA